MRTNPATDQQPNTPRRPRFTVGRDAAGHWIVGDELRLAGGVFSDRNAAMHFAIAECDGDRCGVSTATDGVLSLETLFERKRTVRRTRGRASN